MKKTIILLIVVLSTMISCTQAQNQENGNVSNVVVFRLFPTQNTWNFIKLNTRNGQMWQVQWNTGSNRFETPISLTTRVSIEEEKNGRFFLYPTQNIYNFILLDQFDGRVWQVQWGIKEEDRMVIRIY